MVGACDHNAMLDTFYENGGNFIDTSVAQYLSLNGPLLTI